MDRTGDLPGAEELKQIVLDCVDANLDLIESFEAKIESRTYGETDPAHPDDKVKLILHHHVYHVAGKWRTSSRVDSPSKGHEAITAYQMESMYDGHMTRSYEPFLRSGTIKPGLVDTPVKKDLIYGYRYYGGSLQNTLENATSIEAVRSETGEPLKIRVEQTSKEGTQTLLLNPAHGCLIEEAIAIDHQGRLRGRRNGVELQQAEGGAWFLVAFKDEVFNFPKGDQRTLVSSNEFHADVISVNLPLNESSFDLQFPPGTGVNDLSTGRLYMTPGGRRADAPAQTVVIDLLAAAVVVLCGASLTAIIVRRWRGSHADERDLAS